MRYMLTFKMGNIIYQETFVGSWWGLLVYRFKMRKWKVIKIEKTFKIC